ncbi:hypothetical protein ABGB07_07935 [Micromonosporaceae bacterium B7E4]
MTVKPELIEYIRTFVRDDVEVNDRLEEQLDRDGWENYALFLNAVFFLAIDLYFDGRRDDGAAIQFVADMRAQTDVGGGEIDPIVAEKMILSVFDPDIALDTSPAMVGRIQTHAIYKALTEKEISDKDLDTLLQEAAQVASSG